PALTLLSFSTHAHPPDLHPFPTRRSSDLLPRHRLDDVLVQRDLVRHPEQRVVADVDLRLTRGADLVVLDLDVDARFDETPGHLRSEEHTSELQSRENLVCRLLLEKKNINT